MVIDFDDRKCEIYKNYVLNPEDRSALKAFKKKFNTLDKQVLNLHNRLISAKNGRIYNTLYGIDNRIELKSGCRHNDPQIFKTRINKSYRKFFLHKYLDEYCITRLWDGCFENITHIFVTDINKHDYR